VRAQAANKYLHIFMENNMCISKFNTVAKENFKMSKKVKHASLLDFFMPKAKKSKENPLEDSNEDTDLQADNCVLQQTNDSNKQINEINSDVSHASLDMGRDEDIEN
jgi:hypothetical protein